MKKITQVAETGGAPIYFDDFRDVFNLEIWNAMEALLSGYTSDTEGVIVSGCTVGGSGPSSYTISAGIVFLDGEFMRLAAQTGLSLPQYIKADTAVNTQRTFDDTNLKTLYITKSATVAGSAPGAGQYIAITSTTDPDGRRLKRAVMSVDSNITLYTKVLNLGDWNMDSTDTLTVTHSVTDYKKIRSMSVIIRDDADSAYANLEGFRSGVYSAPDGGITDIGSTTITLFRTAGQTFDGANYNATGYNRGYMTIVYEG